MTNRYIPKSLGEYIELLYKRKALFFIPFIAVILGTLVAYPFLPRVYEASAIVLIEQDKISASLKGLTVDNDFNKKLKTISAQVQSWSNMLRLIQKLGLANRISDQKSFEKLVLEMRERIDMKMLSDRVIRVSYEDKDRDLAYRMTNAVAENVVDIHRREKLDDAKSTIDFIDQQLRVYKDKLQNSEKTFFLSRVDADLNEALKRKELLAGQMAAIEKTVVKEVTKEQNPALQLLKRDLAQSESLYRLMQAEAKENNPLVKELTEKIETLKRRIQFEEESAHGSETSTTNPQYQDLSAKLKDLELTISSLQKRKSDLQEGRLRPGGRVSEEEILAMERDKRVNEDIYQSLLMRLENAHITQRLDERGQGGAFEILDPARMPLKPSKPDPVKTAGMGLLMALAAGAAAVALREFFDTSFRGISDAKESLEMNMLAYIPRIFTRQELETQQKAELFSKNGSDNGVPKSKFMTLMSKWQKDPRVQLSYLADKLKDDKVSPYVVPYHDPGSMPSEQYRLLRTNILFAHKKTPVKTLMVTSGIEGEGKTTTSVSMAVSMAKELNQKILLVDCDLRKCNVAGLLGLKSQPGLSEFLTGSCKQEDILRPGGVDRLTVIPGGKTVSNPTSLLGLEKMEHLMQDLTEKYDFIILDAPPVLNLADVPVLTAFAGAVVLVVRVGKTPREQVYATQAILEQTHRSKILGYVLTQVENYVPSYLYQYVAGGY